MRLIAIIGSTGEVSVSLNNHGKGLVVGGKESVVLDGVEEVAVVMVNLTSEVAFSKLEFPMLDRILVAIRTSAKAVLPHGNSTGNVRKGGVTLN